MEIKRFKTCSFSLKTGEEKDDNKRGRESVTVWLPVTQLERNCGREEAWDGGRGHSIHASF